MLQPLTLVVIVSAYNSTECMFNCFLHAAEGKIVIDFYTTNVVVTTEKYFQVCQSNNQLVCIHVRVMYQFVCRSIEFLDRRKKT